MRNFLQAYAYCVAAFILIWLIFDISDHLSDFLDDRVSFVQVGYYYLTQAPQILIIVLPVSLLLALLFSLGRMSRANEIVSILACGISVSRMIRPLIGLGILTVLAMAALNYSLAPHADLARRTFFETKGLQRPKKVITGQLFRNRAEDRTWFIQYFLPGGEEFFTVQILQQDARDNIVTNYFATRVVYQPGTKSWELQLAKVVHYDEAGNITQEQLFPSLVINNWSETPFRLMSAHLRAEYLSFPELREYMRLNADFPPSLLAPFRTHLHYRMALPWNSLILVFIATPLAIGYARRRVFSNVAAAIILVLAMTFSTHLFLALGEGDRIPAWAAAWAPNFIFATIGLVMLYLRATNQDPRVFNPFAASRAKTS